MNKTFQIYNANSIMLMLMTRNDINHITMSKGQLEISIIIFLDYLSPKAYELSNELMKEEIKDFDVEIQDHKNVYNDDPFTIVKLTWNLPSE